MKKLHFRGLLVLSLLAVFSEFLASGTRGRIPDTVRAAADAQVIPNRIVGVVESALALLFALTAYAGLFLIWRPARWLLLVGVFFQFASLPTIEPWAVYSGWELLAMHLDLCLQGIILAVVFSSLFPNRAS